MKLNESLFEHCLKCSICNDVCPMMAVNPAYPGPKRSGPDGERYRIKAPLFYDEALSFCLGCRRCEVVCPSQVRVADIIQAARLKYGSSKHHLRNAMLANTDFMGSLATKMAPLVNASVSLTPVKYLMHSIIGIDRKRNFPEYASQTFVKWYSKEGFRDGYSKSVSYFHGCYVNYNNPRLGKDLVTILNSVGYGVKLLEGEKCCGVALMSNGFEDKARKNAEANMAAIRNVSGEVLTTSSSCTMMMRNEYPHVLGVDNEDVKDRIIMATLFLCREVEQGRIRLIFRKDYHKKIAYHTACHMERLGWSIFSKTLLRMIPGVELVELPSVCCGISGTFGFKKENYDYSQKIGEKLFDAISRENPDIVACDCETCKWQIEMSTAYKVENPISIIAQALDVEATRKANI